jgi:transcription elongation factor GreA
MVTAKASKIVQEDDQKVVLITKVGLDKLIAELAELKVKGRKDVAEKLRIAISYGDLSENAEYDEAKNQQAYLEARIIEIEGQIKNAEVIEEKHTGEIQIGSIVQIKRMVDGDDHEYTIVGSTEADILAHKISNESPVGMAILGKKAKDIVTITAPGGSYEYEVVAVK